MIGVFDEFGDIGKLDGDKNHQIVPFGNSIAETECISVLR